MNYYSEVLRHSVTKKCKSASKPDNQKGSNSSLSSKKSSKLSRTSSSTKQSKESLNLSDHAPLSNTSYLWLERCKTTQYSQLLVEQNKQRVQGKLLILKKIILVAKRTVIGGSLQG